MTETGNGGAKISCWLWSEDNVLVNEGRREMRMDDERERMTCEEVD